MTAHYTQPPHETVPIYREKLLEYFKYEHLPEHLQSISKKFHDLAHNLCEKLEPSAERTAGLRKLLEAKDCAVRASL